MRNDTRRLSGTRQLTLLVGLLIVALAAALVLPAPAHASPTLTAVANLSAPADAAASVTTAKRDPSPAIHDNVAPLAGEGLIALTKRICGTSGSWRAQADQNGIAAGSNGQYWLYLDDRLTIDCSLPPVKNPPPANPAPEQETEQPAPPAQEPVVRAPAAVVWFHPVPGRCPSMNMGWDGGAWGAGRSYGHHQGQDFGAATGTIIHSIGGGTVVYVGNSGNAGNQVQVQIGDLRVKYNHLSRFSVHTGQWVAPNQKIGEVGATGRAFGSHLHIEIWRNGVDLDPKKYLAAVGVNVYC